MGTPADDEPVICLGGCRRELRDPKSISRGYGPDCWDKLHGPPARRPRLTTPRTGKPGRGQPELPIDEQLDLWSSE